MKDYGIDSDHQAKVKTLHSELAKTPQNVKYVEGLADLEKYIRKEMPDQTTPSASAALDESIARGAKKLAAKYTGIIHIEETFLSLAQPSSKP